MLHGLKIVKKIARPMRIHKSHKETEQMLGPFHKEKMLFKSTCEWSNI